MDRATVRLWRLDELQHRGRGIVDEDELMEDVRVRPPAAGTVVERPVENRPEELVVDVRTVEIWVTGDHDPGSSGPVSLQVRSLDFQPDPAFCRVWIHRMILTDGVRPSPPVHIYISGKREQRTCRLGG